MFTKSNVLATIAGGIVLFFGGWIFYDMLAADFYAAHYSVGATALMKVATLRTMLFIAVGCLVQAFVMPTVFSKLADKSNGFYYGVYFGGFVGFGINFLTYGIMNVVDKTGLLVDGIWSLIFYGIIGWVIAFVSKKFAS